ncbi:hypothetical protein TBR22_A04620 [Luteitalea sp. TBR-22]|uniref:winged helix DNA-binding domain-containing protein n=1 Tax=Luteitalea sp. TBR-22 TaxID=2802971 RepID=UPI001AF32ED2|nr:winged helix DNA-binding domain-containing protein [Luteitalea sp. TBR-22]BCS31262.1 hypothetical protein TBR22_A04620 [Luteitalea sp. TBR-22]
MILPERLRHHFLTGRTRPARPDQVVRWFGAVQAQDFAGALWALAQRLAAPTTEAALLAAFDEGAFIRTHVLRPTWHFVAPEDLRWMLALTAPRVHAANAARYAELGLDARTRAAAERALAKALAGGVSLTRQELAEALGVAGIPPDGQRLPHLLMHAELEGVICSGPRRGKQFTHALVDARVPASPARSRDEALAALMQRYVASHGPVTARDAAWWSGLTIQDVRAGLEAAGDALTRWNEDGITWWVAAGPQAPARSRPRPAGGDDAVHLLPNYDEYVVAYRDRTVLLHPSTPVTSLAQSALLMQPVVHEGVHAGTWRRALPTRRGGPVTVDVQWIERPDEAEASESVAAAERYAAYLGAPLVVEVR